MALGGLTAAAHNLIDKTFAPFDEFETLLESLVNFNTGIDLNDLLTKLGENWQEVIKLNAGFIACLVIGILYVLTMIIGGFIFCCCQCICKKKPSGPSCWRFSHCSAGTIAGVLIFVSMICTFLSNNEMKSVMSSVLPSLSNILTDTNSVMNELVSGVTGIVDSAFALIDEISEKVVGISPEFVDPLVAGIIAVVSTPFATMKVLPGSIQSVKTQLSSLDKHVSDLKSKKHIFETDLDNVRIQLDTDSTSPYCSDSECAILNNFASQIEYSGFNFSGLSDLNVQINAIDAVLGEDIVAEIETAESSFEQVKIDVKYQTTTLTAEVGEQIAEIRKTVTENLDSLDQIDDFIGKMSEAISNIKSSIDGYTNPVDKFVPVVWGVLVGVMAVILIVLLVAVTAKVLGIIADNSWDVEPNQRSVKSEWGGKLLCSASCFSIVLAIVLMTVTTVLFLVSGVARTYACVPLSIDTGFSMLDFVEENLSVIDIQNQVENLNLTWKNGSPEISLSGILKSCEKNDSLYDVLDLEDVEEFDIAGQIDITSYTDSIKSDIQSNLESIISDAVTNELTGWKTEIDEYISDLNAMFDTIDFSNFNVAISNGLSAADDSIDDLILGLTSMSLSDGIAVSARNTAVTSLTDISENSYTNLLTEFDNFKQTVAQLQTDVNTMKQSLISISEDLAAAQTNINNLSTEAETNILAYVDGINTLVTEFLKNSLDTDLKESLRCGNIYSIYDAVFSLVCIEIIDVVHVLWFSTGWCAGILPIAIVAWALLIKYFRRER